MRVPIPSGPNIKQVINSTKHPWNMRAPVHNPSFSSSELDEFSFLGVSFEAMFVISMLLREGEGSLFLILKMEMETISKILNVFSRIICECKSTNFPRNCVCLFILLCTYVELMYINNTICCCGQNCRFVVSEIHTHSIITRGLYIFYPIFHCGLYWRAVYVT